MPTAAYHAMKAWERASEDPGEVDKAPIVVDTRPQLPQFTPEETKKAVEQATSVVVLDADNKPVMQFKDAKVAKQVVQQASTLEKPKPKPVNPYLADIKAQQKVIEKLENDMLYELEVKDKLPVHPDVLLLQREIAFEKRKLARIEQRSQQFEKDNS